METLHNNDAPSDQLKRRIGKVTPVERDEIKALFERKNGLAELFLTLMSYSQAELANSPLYDKIVQDTGGVTTRFQRWWTEKSIAYQWENIQGYRWEIDFDSCEIFLIKQ